MYQQMDTFPICSICDELFYKEDGYIGEKCYCMSCYNWPWRETVFKPITGYEDYKISLIGEVRKIDDDKQMSVFPNAQYLSVTLTRNGKQERKFHHRLMALTFIPNPENKPTVDHINRIKTDNTIDNLRWATSQENNENKEQKVVKITKAESNGKVTVYNSYEEAALANGVTVETLHNTVSKNMNGDMKKLCGANWTSNVASRPKCTRNDEEHRETDYEGVFVTPSGQIYSEASQKYLTQRKSKDGYMILDIQSTREHAHRVVAKAYVPNDNPDTKDKVIHLDHNITNNHYTNLKWCTMREAQIHAAKATSKKYNEPVCNFNMEGIFVEEFESPDDVVQKFTERGLKATAKELMAACAGSQNGRARKFYWKYAKDCVRDADGNYENITVPQKGLCKRIAIFKGDWNNFVTVCNTIGDAAEYIGVDHPRASKVINVKLNQIGGWKIAKVDDCNEVKLSTGRKGYEIKKDSAVYKRDIGK